MPDDIHLAGLLRKSGERRRETGAADAIHSQYNVRVGTGPPSSGAPSIIWIGDRDDDAVARGMWVDCWWNGAIPPGAGPEGAGTEWFCDLARDYVSMVRRRAARSCRTA